MSKKQILIMVLVVVFVAVGAAVGFYIYNKNTSVKNYNTANTSVSSDSKPLNLNSNNSESIPLGGNEQKEQSSNSLSVTNNAPTNSAQLGSGYKSPSGNSGSGSTESANSVPGPETFGQYEQYKTSQTSLYGDIQVGTGGTVTNGKKAAVIYKGYLTNGTLFDENTDPNKPFVFVPGSGQVIRGWEESLPGMKAGGIRRIIVPPAVGYGAKDQGKIPANSVLVFDVQVVAVE